MGGRGRKGKEKRKEKTRDWSSFKYKYTYKNLTQAIYNYKSIQSWYGKETREVCPSLSLAMCPGWKFFAEANFSPRGL